MWQWYEQSKRDVPAELIWLNEWERVHVLRLRIPKRKDDWLLGRWTAKRAVAMHLGLGEKHGDLARIEVWPLPSGAPRLFVDQSPAPLSLSLTHCRETAACLLGDNDATIGCDIEAVESRPANFVDDYFSDEERLTVDAAPSCDRDRMITLIWSAKESALKALRTGLRVDTRRLAVTVEDDFPSGTNAVHGPRGAMPGLFTWRPLSVRFGNDAPFPGSWCWNATEVRTAVETTANRAASHD